MSDAPASSPQLEHARRRQAFAAEQSAWDRRADQLSWLRLSLFLAGATALTAGIVDVHVLWLGVGIALLVGFGVAVIAHARVIAHSHGARVRHDIHSRHISRIGGGWQQLTSTGSTLHPSTHAYALDIDLIGQGSLFQRIDVTHTERGQARLAAWLGEPADADTIRARQVAVAELAAQLDLRQELEASALLAADGAHLEAGRFHEFAQRPLLLAKRPWLVPVSFVLPLVTLMLYVLGELATVPSKVWIAPVLVQIGVLRSVASHVQRTLDLAAARQGVVEAFERMLMVIEDARFQAPLLQQLQQRLAVNAVKPSQHVRRLRRWTGFAELRRQVLLHIVVNPLTLWDLHVLWGLERWIRDVGRNVDDWFDAIADLEALCGLATLAYAEPAACFPTLAADDGPLTFVGLEHPLLPASTRVGNDVQTTGPGSALVITGSNMAGKSTLLRAVGVNVALALAGGPVCAKSASVPRVRLRASMRADDSLQSGASYFHAELTKLRRVVESAEATPPVFFLLDELLRGTNARARHLGAKAVLLHLLARRGSGLVATHDAMLGQLEEELPGRVQNFHFTDVILNGEMTFDYRLHPGVVRTSNALRLLAMAGIDVPESLQQDSAVDSPNVSDVAPTGDTLQ